MVVTMVTVVMEVELAARGMAVAVAMLRQAMMKCRREIVAAGVAYSAQQ